jgi:DNA-binding transcriptional MerR regulator
METYTISELSREFNVSTRTIRYYEEIGIIHPLRRDNGQRGYTKKDRTRLKLIFRGKKFGFSLAEIKEMIELFDVDPSGEMQLKKTLEYGRKKIDEMNERIRELTDLRDEITILYYDFQKRISPQNETKEEEDEYFRTAGEKCAQVSE